MNLKLQEHIVSIFKSTFKNKPILVFAPGRINLIGEHTDYNNGFVFPAAIDKGIYAAINKNNNDFCTVIADDLNEKFDFELKNIYPIDKGNWKNYVLGVVAEIQKKGKQLSPFNAVFGGDIPFGAGLSSSAALENSFVFGLNELFQLALSKEEMISISQKAEHNFVGVQCGIMDQYASMFGKENTALLLDCKTLKTRKYTIDFNKFELLLINTNVQHSLSESAYNNRRAVCEKVSTLLHKESLREVTETGLNTLKNNLSESDYQKALYVIQENNRVLKAAEAIKNNDLKLLGELLYQSHNGLQHQYKVSCDELDFLVNSTKKEADILGARMMGGGFGGCTINLIKKERISKFSNYIQAAYLHKFNKKCSIYSIQLSNGTHLITNQS